LITVFFVVVFVVSFPAVSLVVVLVVFVLFVEFVVLVVLVEFVVFVSFSNNIILNRSILHKNRARNLVWYMFMALNEHTNMRTSTPVENFFPYIIQNFKVNNVLIFKF